MNFEEMNKMDQMDLSDKMQQAHKDMFRTMLGVNEVPLSVLQRYFLLKITLDRICGHFTPCDLLRVAMDVGFNLETRLFEKTVLAANEQGICRPIKVPDEIESQTAEATETVAEPEPETDEAFSYKTCDKCDADIINGECDCQPEQEDEKVPVEEAVSSPEPESINGTPKEPEPEPEAEPTKTFLIGTAVQVLIDGGADIINGKINGQKEKDGKQVYSVVRDDNGELVEEVAENEIQVI